MQTVIIIVLIIALVGACIIMKVMKNKLDSMPKGKVVPIDTVVMTIEEHDKMFRYRREVEKARDNAEETRDSAIKAARDLRRDYEECKQNLDNAIKARILAEAEVATAHKESDEAKNNNKMKSAFLANMSHEIRTPLNAIMGFTQLLISATDETEKEEYGKVITSNSELLINLINDILDLSKIEAGKMVFENSDFDLTEVFNSFKYMFGANMKPDVVLNVVIPYDHCYVNMDQKHVTQVLNNFMSNAVKYTPRGSIILGYEYVNSGVRMYVRDTGIGISEAKQSDVFNRFKKLDNVAQGTGLGLAICKATAEALHGKIGFNTEEGKGSEFWIWIPGKANIVGKRIFDEDVTPVEVPVVQVLPPTSPRNENNVSTPSSAGVTSDNTTKKETSSVAATVKPKSGLDKTYNILAAEDNDSNFTLLRAVLKGQNLDRACNGQEAVDMVGNNSYDIILMDMRMPVMDGLEATREIRRKGHTLPIIAVTANAFGQDKENALKAGCDDFLPKPVTKNELNNIIRQYAG